MALTNPIRSRYNRRAALLLGILQILVGSALVASQVAVFMEDLLYLEDIALGLWTGLLVLVAGSVALVSSIRVTIYIIISVFLASVVSLLLSGIGLWLACLYNLQATLPSGSGYSFDTDAYKYKLVSDVTITHVTLFLVEGVLSVAMLGFCLHSMSEGNQGPRGPAHAHITLEVTSDHEAQATPQQNTC